MTSTIASIKAGSKQSAKTDAKTETSTSTVLMLANETATAALAAALAPLARRGDILALSGDLGSGKTVFARAFIHARIGAQEEVPSPTFTLVQTYPAADNDQPAVFHFDLFRIEDPEQASALGLEDAFAEGISLIEWPERLCDRLPAHHLSLHFAYGSGENERRVELLADGSWFQRLRDAGLV